jgi:hypothetical protein
MTEWYPDDGALLALETDAATGVEYIPTGQSPYYLSFRKLVQRLLRVAERANDLRVYQDGALSVGVRGGRCVIGGDSLAYAGESGVAVSNNTTTSVWLDAAGVARTGESGFPTDRVSHVRLAEVVASAGAITEVRDYRGEWFGVVADLAGMGVTAGRDDINRALDGIGAGVDAAALTRLTEGAESTADVDHRHERMYTDADSEKVFTLTNAGAGASANVGLRFDLPGKMAGVTDLLLDEGHGFLRQRYLGVSYGLVGSSRVTFGYEGAMGSSQTGKLMGVVPLDGVVSDVILSVGQNMVSSVSTDGVSATVKVNGVAVTSADPELDSVDGTGFRCTCRGDGVAATVQSDGTERVSKGGVLTVDVTRTAAGTVSVEPGDVVVMVVIRADGPE